MAWVPSPARKFPRLWVQCDQKKKGGSLYFVCSLPSKYPSLPPSVGRGLGYHRKGTSELEILLHLGWGQGAETISWGRGGAFGIGSRNRRWGTDCQPETSLPFRVWWLHRSLASAGTASSWGLLEGGAGQPSYGEKRVVRYLFPHLTATQMGCVGLALYWVPRQFSSSILGFEIQFFWLPFKSLRC